jgi:hypothetical protein
MMRFLLPAAALAVALTIGFLATSISARAAEGPVRDYYCNGIPLGPCALPESETEGRIIEWCQNVPLGNGTFHQRCMNIRVVRNDNPDGSAAPASDKYFTPAGNQPVIGCRRRDVALTISANHTMTAGEFSYASHLGDCTLGAGPGERLHMIREDGAALLLESHDPRLPSYWYARSDMQSSP